MKYGVRTTSRHKKSIKKMLKRGKDNLLILSLADTGTHSDLGL